VQRSRPSSPKSPARQSHGGMHLYNDMHTALNGGFTYNGVHYTGDAANIAQGDNFLSKVKHGQPQVPRFAEGPMSLSE
jgi:hypothetical protein